MFACNLIASANLSSFQVSIQTKDPRNDNTGVNIEDVGTAFSVTLTDDTVSTFERGIKIDGSESTQGFLEFVRYKYVVTSTATRGWVNFRMLDPTWEND